MGHSLKILLVEDDDNDALLLKRALAKQFAAGSIFRVENGEAAIAYLSGNGKFHDREKFPFPDIIITDLKMPRLSGFELLAWIHDHKEYRVIPTIVLSSSNAHPDVTRAYNLGANTYLVKPNDFESLMELARLIRDYWAAGVRTAVREDQ